MLHWGRHCIINARKCQSLAISNPRNIELFTAAMLRLLSQLRKFAVTLNHTQISERIIKPLRQIGKHLLNIFQRLPDILHVGCAGVFIGGREKRAIAH